MASRSNLTNRPRSQTRRHSSFAWPHCKNRSPFHLKASSVCKLGLRETRVTFSAQSKLPASHIHPHLARCAKRGEPTGQSNQNCPLFCLSAMRRGCTPTVRNRARKRNQSTLIRVSYDFLRIPFSVICHFLIYGQRCPTPFQILMVTNRGNLLNGVGGIRSWSEEERGIAHRSLSSSVFVIRSKFQTASLCHSVAAAAAPRGRSVGS